MKYLLIGFIKLWRLLISPLYGRVCRYYPSCSQYGLDSVRVHGTIKGSWLIIKRLARCTPWHAGGYDPVPGTPEAREWAKEQQRIAEERAAFARADPPNNPETSRGDDDGIDSVITTGHTGTDASPDQENRGTN
ncbi:membrane protein insertion efficiency factor YidD [Propioniferax innocua]|uniref:Putative membrane protein insertion efficiency factor n=1 Tax=Propioniferax innocua TaxID=1753 RepID=A0A542ZDU7_9ACTN|nr:membrane protein insertion efficiency factor YidD [Propioniferax innocua]TQL58430.1 hypothetical protein FB460_2292 [Propioniferax innocua]